MELEYFLKFIKEKAALFLIFSVIFSVGAYFYQFYIAPDLFEASFIVTFNKVPENTKNYRYEGFYILKTLEEFTDIMQQIINSYTFEKKLYGDDFRKFLDRKITDAKKISYNSIYFSFISINQRNVSAFMQKAEEMVKEEVDDFNEKFFKDYPLSVSFENLPEHRVKKNKWFFIFFAFFAGAAFGFFIGIIVHFFTPSKNGLSNKK